MWISAEILGKQQTKTGFDIIVQYGTDDTPPIMQQGSVQLGPGQDESTLKGAIVQQLADLNAQDQLKLQTKGPLVDLAVAVDAIPLGPVDLTGVKIITPAGSLAP